MPFSEAIKLEAKRKAHYKCCICRGYGFLDVHHIIPESGGGPDTLDNAVPLCAGCHDTYGNDHNKRKWIKEKRDFWFELCEKTLSNEDMTRLKETSETLEKMMDIQTRNIAEVEGIRKKLQTDMEYYARLQTELISKLKKTDREQETVIQIGSVSSTILSVSGTMSGTYSAMTQLGPGIYVNPTCPRCGSNSGLYVSNDPSTPICSNCGTPMR